MIEVLLGLLFLLVSCETTSGASATGSSESASTSSDDADSKIKLGTYSETNLLSEDGYVAFETLPENIGQGLALSISDEGEQCWFNLAASYQLIEKSYAMGNTVGELKFIEHAEIDFDLPEIGMEAGKKYKLTFWAQSPSPSISVVRLRSVGSDGISWKNEEYGGHLDIVKANAMKWRPFEIRFTADEDLLNRTNLQIVGLPGAVLYIDGFQIIPLN